MATEMNGSTPRQAAERRWRRFVQEVREGKHLDFAEHWQLFRSLAESVADAGGPLAAWWPGEPEQQESNLSMLLREVGAKSYQDLHLWSVEHRQDFWRRVISRLGIEFRQPPETILDLSAGVEQPRWLSGARLNIIDSCFQAPADTPAIIHASETEEALRTVTYGELERRVDQIANGLRDHGFEEDQAIALYMPMTVDCVAAYLGIIRAGARVVSVADSFSAAELRKRMEISQARAVISVASYRRAGRRIDLYGKVHQALSELKSEARCILIPAEDEKAPPLAAGDLHWGDFLGAETPFASAVGVPERITNVLFSSGTTGSPKAIPWTQLTPIKCGMDARYHHDIRPGDVVAWPTNIGWMMGPWLIYATFLNQATMALHGGAPHTADFTAFVKAAGITMLGLVPALVRAWRAEELVAQNAWQRVRLFSSTGEASNSEDYLWLMSRTGYRAPVIEYLGGTEIGGGHITGSVLQPASPATFTTPALGIDFVVLDEAGHPVSEGETGELFLIPPSIGLSQALLNKDHHVSYYESCPTGPDGEVLRRHGDETARLGGGFFKAQGRADDTMNLGGIKVSSIELEEVINDHPQVFESAAIAVRPSGEGADRLVVYVVPQTPCDLERLHSELARQIATRLNPLFKIHEVLTIDALPRTASNKVMRRELRRGYEPTTSAR
jgi:acetyl-CoA synthetase